jgi:Flp pilus assembly protein TadG
MVHQTNTKRQAGAKGYPHGSRKNRMSRGQSAVEFALMSSIALAVMLIGVQFALIGQAALAVSQGASALARYAAVNPGTMGPNSSVAASALPSAAQQLLSSSILTNSGTDLTVTVASFTGTTTTTTSSPGYTDRAVVSMSYNAASKIFLPSSTLLGITFPTTLTASDSQMYE